MKQEIEIEVPDGMEIDKNTSHLINENIYMIRLQKKKPHRIILEEIGEPRQAHKGDWWQSRDGKSYYYNDSSCLTEYKYKIYREVKENS